MLTIFIMLMICFIFYHVTQPNWHIYYLSRVVRKPDFCLCENKGADQLRSNCEADQRLYFRNKVSKISLLLKSEISSLLLRLYRPVCVRPGRKPRRPVFSCCGSFYVFSAAIVTFSTIVTCHALNYSPLREHLPKRSYFNILANVCTYSVLYCGNNI